MAGDEPEPTAQAPTRRVSGRAWLAGVLLKLLGVLIVIAAPDALNVAAGSYWEGVVANVGVAVLLAGPLLLAERAISGQLTRVDRRVEAARRDSRQARAEVQRVAEDTRATLSELTREVREGLDRVRADDRSLHDRVARRRQPGELGRALRARAGA